MERGGCRSCPHHGVLHLLFEEFVDLGGDHFAAEDTREAIVQAALE